MVHQHAKLHLPSVVSKPDHHIADITVNNFNYLASPSTCIDLMWRDSFGDVPRYPRADQADGSGRAEHHKVGNERCIMNKVIS